MASLQFHGGSDENVAYAERDLDVQRVRQLFGVHLKIQWAIGMMPMPSLPAWLPDWLQSLLRLFTVGHCLLVLSISLHLGLLFSKTTLDALPTGKLEDITDALTMTIIYFFTAYATSYWCLRSKRMLRFLAHINQGYRHHSLAGVCFVNMHSTYRWFRSFTLVWLSACLSGVISWGITPLMMGNRTLPLHCWYPFDAMDEHFYSIVYAVQLYGQITVGTVFAYGGFMFVSLSFLLLGQFDVLYCSLKNLDAHARLLAGESLQALRYILPIVLDFFIVI